MFVMTVYDITCRGKFRLYFLHLVSFLVKKEEGNKISKYFFFVTFDFSNKTIGQNTK